ncbi:MAG: fibronectin [Candidatus Neomarinimicrobiota bacterium]
MDKHIVVWASVLSFSFLWAQVGENEKRYVRVGTLQSHFSAYGSERAWNNTYYEGLIWPADYPYQDNAVIKRAWIAATDFTDSEDEHWDVWGTYISSGYVQNSLFPMKLTQVARFESPVVFVDGNNITAPYAGDVDEFNPGQIPDRIVTNVVNTSLGLTMTRRVLAFSQQYHDNYFIKEFVFTNTGNVDFDDDIELNATLKGVRIGWGTRYSVSREGSIAVDGQQSWGKHTWVSKRGEDYPSHAAESITEDNPIVDWIRCGFSWFGQSERVSFDNIGAPDVRHDGRLTSPHHAGSAILHVDKSVTDRSDDPHQPAVLGWHAGDSYPSVGNITPSDMNNMIKLYDFLSGKPYPSENSGDTLRMDETFLESITHRLDPYTIHNDGGGTNVWICYGPFDIPPGDSIVIVEAEGISGLSRQECEEIGRRWKKAYDNPSDSGPFILPDGSETSDKDVFKNTWVYTGKDSILQTFGRAKRNYDLGYLIPQPPLPPPVFEVTSGGDKIMLTWSTSPTEGEPDFAGYKIFRAVGKPDTTYEQIAALSPGETLFDDVTAVRGFSYYYYIVAYNDGSSNSTGEANPMGILHSSRFYTRTTEPAFLRRPAGKSLEKIRVVPNPFHIAAGDLQYTGEKDKIMFLNIPARCTIKIFTERGDLIKTINHADGSGDEAWNSVTSSRQVVVSGIYLAHFKVTEDYTDPATEELLYRKGDTAIRKFVVIR